MPTLTGPSVSLVEESADPSSEHYDIEGEYARGGLGRVLKAWDRRLKRSVAIKELLAVRVEHVRRFVREMEITASLRHPGIVPIYEAGRWNNGTPFYVMKFVSGRTLRELIADAVTLADRLALLPNVLMVADTVTYAHAEGIVHRDLKPSNVLLGNGGETVVIDWGLAKSLSEPPEPSDPMAAQHRASADGQTLAGTVLGTPSYMPPEQACGAAVDTRADVYALGAVLFQVLTGVPPFSGNTAADVLERVLSQSPPSVETVQPGVPPELATVVQRAMERSARDRYPSAKAMADDLRRFLRGEKVHATYGVPVWPMSRRPWGRIAEFRREQ
jgi:serine/threonine protein kinase